MIWVIPTAHKIFPSMQVMAAVCKCSVYIPNYQLNSLFQQLTNQINEMHNLALLHAIRFFGKILSLVILSQWQPGKLFLCSAHLLAVLSAVSLIQSLEGLSFSACQARLSLNTTGSKVNSSAHAVCFACGLFWVKYLFYVFMEKWLFFVVHCNLSTAYDSLIYW